MSDSNQFALHFFLPIWFILAGCIVYCLVIWARLVKVLAEIFPDYYEKIGKPYAFYSSSLSRQMSTQSYMFKLLLKRLPADLPQDAEVLDLVQRLRKFWRLSFLPFSAAILVSLYASIQGY